MGTLNTSQLLEKWPCLTKGQLDYILHDRECNGLKPWVTKKGRRLYVDEEGFEAWFLAQDGEHQATRTERELEIVYKALSLLAEDYLSLGSKIPQGPRGSAAEVVAKAVTRASM